MAVMIAAVAVAADAATTINAFGAYDLNSGQGYDQGYATFRAVIDVNADHRADYCRFVGASNTPYLSCGLATGSGFGNYDFNSAPGIDLGYSFFRALVDVNADGRADYCRFVGSSSTPYLSCALAKSNNTFGNYDFNSASGIDLGYATFRALADVNTDGRADYCRFVGSSSTPYLSCALAKSNNTFGNYDFNSASGIDQGYATFRALADVNADGRADYCRFVGSSSTPYLSCALAKSNNTFGNYDFNSAPGIDQGYSDFRALVDINADGRADYCRFVGPSVGKFLSCALAMASGFGNYEVNGGTPYDIGYATFRAMADVNADGRADYVRFVGNNPSVYLSAGLAKGITIIDIIPKTLSAETYQDSEPFLSADPSSAQRMAASAFTPNPAGPTATTAPIFVTSDGGGTWTLNNIVPSQSITSDISHAFDPAGALYAGIVKRPPMNLPLNELRTPTFLTGPTMTVQASRLGVDQPFVSTNAISGSRIYVGLNDFAAPSGRTATVDVSNNGGTSYTPVRLEKRATPGQNAPSIRLAVASNNVVYAAFFGWRAFSGTSMNAIVTSDVVINRDDNGGFGANPFGALIDTGVAGKRIVTNRSIPWSPVPTLGQERLGSTLSTAVDPSNSAIVYVAWGDRTGSDIYTLHVRRSTDSGVTWSGSDLRTLSNATNPALAINLAGVVALMYQQVSVVSGTPRWVTHLEQTKTAFATTSDTILASVPTSTPPMVFLPYLGDYAYLMALNKEFRGIFCAGNKPDSANFPSGVTFQRAISIPPALNNGSGGSVAVSIDPFYFSVPAIP
ncbi:MAG TPA: hypothetical protein VH394_12940 [Thermoanaerobaculia bacterium]|nr:hypothetical protein [Thermoanaerobaculia bacterium]